MADITNFEHIQLINYAIQIGSNVVDKVAIFNCNKLPYGVAVQCLEVGAYNPYLITMTKEQFNRLFLDDRTPTDERKDSNETD